jgi:hypothetical protein
MRFLFGVFIFFLVTGFFAALVNPIVAVVLGLGAGWYAGSD